MLNKNGRIYKAQVKFASKGIYAMYGGRKGNGFWLYKLTNAETALSLVASFDPALWDKSVVNNIQNDGKNSGNVHFWMYNDAMFYLRSI